MNTLLKYLHENYCQELNAAWLQCVGSFDGQHLTEEQLAPFAEKMKEAWQDGYHIQPHYDCSAFIRDRIMAGSNEQQLLQHSAWRDVGCVKTMMNTLDKEKDNWVLSNLENLRAHYTDIAMKNFPTGFVQQNGPFYMGKDTSVILAYGHLGDVVLEILFINLMRPFEHEPGGRRKGGVV